MKYICAKCKKEFDYTGKDYGGYVIDSGKDLCPECWKKYLEIKSRHHREIKEFWEVK